MSAAAPVHPPRFAAAALAAGLLAAVALPDSRLGAGVLLVALALAFAARLATPGRGADDGDRHAGRWRRVWAALALLLAAAPLVRDATWVVLPALTGSVVLGSLAVTGGATWPALLRGATAALAALPRGAGETARAAAAARPPGAAARLLPIVRGAVLALGLVGVFGALFATGDRAFSELAGNALPSSWDLGPLPLRVLCFAAVAALAGAYALARRRGAGAGPPAPGHRLGGVEWGVGLGALNLLFAAFVAVQFAVLFGRDDHVLETAGLTYAEYAREGFGQLLVAAALTLGVAGAALRYSVPSARPALRALLACLLALTLVVLASALHRLGLYEAAFGATRLRITAQVTLLLVGVLLVLVLAALAAGRFAWLPRACTLVAALVLAGLVALDPDRRIAERNLDRFEATGLIDGWYLETLSADATPVLPDRFRGDQRARLREADGWAGFSLARVRARDALR